MFTRSNRAGVTGSPSPEERPTHLTIKVKDQAEGEMVFRFKYTTPLSRFTFHECLPSEDESLISL